MINTAVRNIKRPVSVPDESKKAVMQVIDTEKYPDMTEEGLYLIWSSKTLDNWKAQVSSDIEGFPLYEITHNGNKNETYVDVYTKQSNHKLVNNEGEK